MVTPSMLGLLFSWTGVLVVVLSIIHVVICVFLLLVVLLQRGRSGDVMSAFGGPTPSSYAAMSSDDLFSRLTKIGAFSFMATSLLLALLATQTDSSVVTDDELGAPATASAPADAAPADAAPAPADASAPPVEAAPADAAPAPADGSAPPAEAAPADAAPAPADGSAPPADAAPAGATSTTP